jgi:hypothetical protein
MSFIDRKNLRFPCLLSEQSTYFDTRNGFQILKNIYGNDENVWNISIKLLKRRIGNPQVFFQKIRELALSSNHSDFHRRADTRPNPSL